MLPSPPELKPNYGIDAPGLVRGFFISGLAGTLLGLILWRLADSFPAWWQSVAYACFFAGLPFLLTSLVMLWGSKIGKLKLRDRLLDQLQLKGDEQVLDVGCGRGLMVLGAAKRLTTGKAVGIDLWQVQDQSGNAITTTEENARREGVAERVELHTGNMCELPFEDGRFDVIVSSWAVHNVADEAGRRKAVSEMARVLKPKGLLVLVDISYTKEYQTALAELGWQELQRRGPDFTFVIPSYQIWARKP